MFTLGPGKRSTAEKLLGQFAPAIRTRKGFKSVTFLGDHTVGEYGALVVFESKEDADATFEALFPQLQQAVAGIAESAPIRRLFEVLEPEA
jgi:hypothetical protein